MLRYCYADITIGVGNCVCCPEWPVIAGVVPAVQFGIGKFNRYTCTGDRKSAVCLGLASHSEDAVGICTTFIRGYCCCECWQFVVIDLKISIIDLVVFVIEYGDCIVARQAIIGQPGTTAGAATVVGCDLNRVDKAVVGIKKFDTNISVGVEMILITSGAI